MAGYVYVLSNPAMPDLIKIGCSKHHPTLRSAALSSSSGVPLPFAVECFGEFVNFQHVEQWIHSRMSGYRLANNREFFEDALHEAVCWIYHHPERRAFEAAPDLMDRLEIGAFEDVLNPWKVTM